MVNVEAIKVGKVAAAVVQQKIQFTFCHIAISVTMCLAVKAKDRITVIIYN
jgi:hypothetical protein